MDDPLVLLAALKLQIAWGADEALAEAAIDRQRPAPLPAGPVLATVAPPAAIAGPTAPPPAIIGAAARAVALAAQAATPEALRAALEGFDGCDLRTSATHLVFADGNPRAGLVIIGEAPGADEDRSGRAFAGPGGQLLDRMLASIRLDRTQCLLTYAIPWRPPGNRPVNETEVAACLPFLHRHLALLRPRRLVLLGALPTRALTGVRQPMSRARGRWTDVRIPGLETPVPALAMLHPDQLIAQPAARQDAWNDLLMLRRDLDKDAVQP